MDDARSGGGFAALFASPTLVSLLRLFLARPDSDFYQRELAGLTRSRRVQVQRDLLRLEGAGLVARRRHGSRVYYRVRSHHLAFVYGSVAGGRGLAASDVDVLLVSGHDPRVLATVLAEAGEQLGREVNVTAYATDEFRASA